MSEKELSVAYSDFKSCRISRRTKKRRAPAEVAQRSLLKEESNTLLKIVEPATREAEEKPEATIALQRTVQTRKVSDCS